MKNISDKRNPFIASLTAVPACQRPHGDTDWFPAVDLTETGQEYVFEVDLPGVKPDEIQLRVDNQGLCISGQRVPTPQGGKRVRRERPSGVFVRRLPLPPDAQGEIHATLCDGVLDLRVPRACPDDKLGQTHALAREPLEAAA
jgi:HSP20 family protein